MKFGAALWVALLASDATMSAMADGGVRGSALLWDEDGGKVEWEPQLEDSMMTGGEGQMVEEGGVYSSEAIFNGILPPAEWKRRYLEDSMFAVPEEEQECHQGSYLQRMLADDGTWVRPSEDELADMIIADLDRQKAQNGTASFSVALTKVAEHILNTSPINDDKDLDWFYKMFELKENSTAYRRVEDAAIVADGNHTLCSAPDKCMTKERLILIKDFIKDRLNEYAMEGKEPDMSKIYERLEKELDVPPSTADKLIYSSPTIRKYLKDKVRKVERLAIKKELHPLAKKLEKILLDAGHNMTEFEDALLGIDEVSEDDVMAALRSLTEEERKNILDALALPKQQMAKQVEEAYAKQNETQIANHTYFRKTGEVDDTGRHLLEYHPHPSEMRYEDHVRAIDNTVRRRRLARNAKHNLPADTSDFERRLLDHVAELKGHIRELQLSCAHGESATRCVANRLEGEVSALTAIEQQIKGELSPLSNLLGQLKSAQSTIDSVYAVANAVYIAIGIAANIPGVGKLFFKAVKTGMSPLHSMFKKADQMGDRFESAVGSKWRNSIDTVERIMSAFDPAKIYFVVQGANTVAKISESVCMRSLTDHIAPGVIGSIETAIGVMKNYLDKFLGGMKNLRNVLVSHWWTAMENTLNSIVGSIEPVRRFFAPFIPLGELITRKITIRPWFTPPRGMRNLGQNTCEHGYYRDGIIKTKCWEPNSWSWERFHIPFRMRLTCQHGGMGGHWSGYCYNPYYYRASSQYHLLHCWCGCWFCSCGGCRGPHCANGHHKHSWFMPWRCHEHCRWDYTEILHMCRKTHCPWGFWADPLKIACHKTHTRWQYSRNTVCHHHNWKKHWQSGWKQDIFGNCIEGCRHGEKEFLGLCFGDSALHVSIQDIFNAFQSVFDFIKNIPGLKQVMDAIEYVVGLVLRPVTSLIDAWLAKLGLKVPEFPTINIDTIPFAAFDHIPEMPEPPDLTALTELPMTAYNKVLEKLPQEFKDVAACGTDLSCVANAVGIGNPADLMDKALDVLNELRGIDDLFASLLYVVKCASWTKKTIPASDVLATAGFPDINACDIDVPICESLDFSGAKVILEKLKALFEPVGQVIENIINAGGRRLMTHEEKWAAALKKDMFLPLIGSAWEPALLYDSTNGLDWGSNMKTRTLFLAPYKWERGKWIRNEGTAGNAALANPEKQPVGMHFRGELSIFFDMGLLRRAGKWNFGLKIGSKVELKGGTTVGVDGLITVALATAKKIRDHESNESYKKCFRSVTPTAAPTDMPTPAPTTKKPTPHPTPNPTTAKPTPNPTTAKPTPHPTPRPTTPNTLSVPNPNPGPLNEAMPPGRRELGSKTESTVPKASQDAYEQIFRQVPTDPVLVDKEDLQLLDEEFDADDVFPLQYEGKVKVTGEDGEDRYMFEWERMPQEESDAGTQEKLDWDTDEDDLPVSNRTDEAIKRNLATVSLASPSSRRFNPLPGYRGACYIIRDQWLPLTQTAPPADCSINDMTVLDAELNGRRGKLYGPSRAQTIHGQKCIRHWQEIARRMGVHEAEFKRQYEGVAKRQKHGNVGGTILDRAAITLEDMKKSLIVKSDWVCNAKIPTVAGVPFFGGPDTLGVKNFAQLVQWGLGFEIKDPKGKTRLGPMFKFGLDGAFKGWNFGEFGVLQVAKFLVWGKLSLFLDKNDPKKVADLAAHKAALQSAMHDTFASFFFIMEVAGVVDVNAPIYLGCYIDGWDRALPHYKPELTHQLGGSPDKCIYECRDDGHGYAGVQNGNECWCGSDTYGKYKARGVAISECGGSNAATNLGGPWRNSVWSTNGLYHPKKAVKDPVFQGCWIDHGTRAMTRAFGWSYTLETCKNACLGVNYQFFALQAGNYCFCSNGDEHKRYGKAADSDCNSGCLDGNAAPHCGGGWRNAVWSCGDK